MDALASEVLHFRAATARKTMVHIKFQPIAGLAGTR